MGGLWGDIYYPKPTLAEKFSYLVDWIKYMSHAFIEELRPKNISRRPSDGPYISIITDQTPGYELPYQETYKREPVKMINRKLVEITIQVDSNNKSKTLVSKTEVLGSNPSLPARRNINLRR